MATSPPNGFGLPESSMSLTPPPVSPASVASGASPASLARGPSSLRAGSSASGVSVAALRALVMDSSPESPRTHPHDKTVKGLHNGSAAISTTTATFGALASVRQEAHKAAAMEKEQSIANSISSLSLQFRIDSDEGERKPTPRETSSHGEPLTPSSRPPSFRRLPDGGSPHSAQIQPKASNSARRGGSGSSTRSASEDAAGDAQEATPRRTSKKAAVPKQSSGRLTRCGTSGGAVKASPPTTAGTAVTSHSLSLSPSSSSLSPLPTLPTVPESSALDMSSPARSRGNKLGSPPNTADVSNPSVDRSPAKHLGRHRQNPSSFPLRTTSASVQGEPSETDEGRWGQDDTQPAQDRVRVHSQLQHFRQEDSVRGPSQDHQPIESPPRGLAHHQNAHSAKLSPVASPASHPAPPASNVGQMPRKPSKAIEPTLGMRKRGGNAAPSSARGVLGQQFTSSPPPVEADAMPHPEQRPHALQRNPGPSQSAPAQASAEVSHRSFLNHDDQMPWPEKSEAGSRGKASSLQTMLVPSAAAVEPLQPLNSSFSTISSPSPTSVKPGGGKGGGAGRATSGADGRGSSIRRGPFGGPVMPEVVARERRGAAVAAPPIESEEDVIMLAEVQARARALHEQQELQKRKQLLEFQRSQLHAHVEPKVATQHDQAGAPVTRSPAAARKRAGAGGRNKAVVIPAPEPEPIDPQKLLADLHEKAATAGPTRIPAPVFTSGQRPREAPGSLPHDVHASSDDTGPTGYFAQHQAGQPQQEEHPSPQQRDKYLGHGIYYKPYTIKDYNQDKEGLFMGAVDPRTGQTRYQELPKGLGPTYVGSEEHAAKLAAKEKARIYAEQSRLKVAAEAREREEHRAASVMNHHQQSSPALGQASSPALVGSVSSPSLLFSSPLRAAGAAATAGPSLGAASTNHNHPFQFRDAVSPVRSTSGAAEFASPADAAVAALRQMEQRYLDRELELEALALQRELEVMERQQHREAAIAGKLPFPPPPAPTSSSAPLLGGYASSGGGHQSSSSSVSPRRLVDAAEEKRQASQAAKNAHLAAMRKKAREFARAVPPAQTGKSNLPWHNAPPDSKYTALFSEKLEDSDDEDDEAGLDDGVEGQSEDDDDDFGDDGQHSHSDVDAGRASGKAGMGAYRIGRGTGLDDGDNIPTLAITKGALRAAAAEKSAVPRADARAQLNHPAAAVLQEHLRDDRRRRGSSSSSTQGGPAPGSKTGGGGGSTARRSELLAPAGSAPDWIKKITKERRKRERSNASAASHSPKNPSSSSSSASPLSKGQTKGLAASLHASTVSKGQLYPLSDAELSDLLALATAGPGEYIASKQEEELRAKEERHRLRREKKERRNRPDFSPVRAVEGESQAQYYSSSTSLPLEAWQRGPPLHMAGGASKSTSTSPTNGRSGSSLASATILPLSNKLSTSVAADYTPQYGISSDAYSGHSRASGASGGNAWWMASSVQSQVDALRSVRKATSPSSNGSPNLPVLANPTSPHSPFGGGPVTVLPSTLPATKRSPVVGKGGGQNADFPISVEVPGLRGLDALQNQQSKQVEAIKKSLAGSLKTP